MSVTAAVTLTQNLGLVQVTEADPKRLLKWTSTAVADAGGGRITSTVTVPAGLAVVWLNVSVQITGLTANNIAFAFAEDGATFLFGGMDASRAVDTFIAPSALELPAPVILFGDSLACIVVVDNNNTENLTVAATALAWDQETARQLPQRFLWPTIVT